MKLSFFKRGKIVTSITIVFIYLCLVFDQLHAQHRVDLICSTTSVNEFRLKPNSTMFEGNVKKDYIIMESLDLGQDGDIKLILNSFSSSNEDVKITLVDPNDANVYFGIRLKSNKIFIEQKYNGQIEEIELISYNNGDIYKVHRCNTQIIYYVNGTMVNIFDLDDNNFILAGEIDLVSGANINFNSSIEFNKN